MSDNEIYLLIKYIKSVLWRAAKRLSYIEDARCPNVIGHLLAYPITTAFAVKFRTLSVLVPYLSAAVNVTANIFQKETTSY